MLIDFNDLPAGADLQTDVCIVGAGAAGITLAHTLRNTGIDICLLESGGANFNQDIQQLYGATNVGLETSPLGCRLRYFGGTTNHWSGYCTTLRSTDFEKRDWIPNSGWPINEETLAPYYEQAHKICGLGPFSYEQTTYENPDLPYPELDSNKLALDFWQFSPPTRFAEEYRQSLESAENIRLLLHANVTNLEVNENATRVRQVSIRNLDGKTGSITARHVVLACGGIENARLLLLSNNVQQEGLGNRHDQVGRHFMQNVAFRRGGKVLSADKEKLARLFVRQPRWSTQAMTGFQLSPSIQRERQLLNCGCTLRDISDHRDDGYLQLRKLWHDFREGRIPDQLDDKLWTILRDLDGVADGVASGLEGETYKPAVTSLAAHIRCEQMPNPDSRITLGEDLDALGQRRVIIDWRLSSLERQSIRALMQALGEEFGRIGLGRIQMADFLLDDDRPWPQPIWSGCHHKGTTRMSESPQQGVVDTNCRLHSVNNLFIAGSSVFPTASYVTPTLTIVALAVRLADHLKSLLKS
jgi:choline dehydrogenase-like flavoprotein